MVEYNAQLDSIFLSLADSTRRDMIRLLSVYNSMSIGEIAAHYRLTFAGVSKHLKVLEASRLIRKRKAGRQQIVSLEAQTFKTVEEYIKHYEVLWNDRFDRLDALLKEETI
jgi:DNA-binding transcriptional ArsR family regulator